MVKSMTGFGKHVSELADKKITVEVRSLNSKQLDLSVRIPGQYREKELELRSELGRSLERGKVDLTVYVESTSAEKSIAINRSLALNYYNELQALAGELGQQPDDYLSLIIKMPDVLRPERQELDENEWSAVKAAVDKAIEAFNRFREDEGKVLQKEFEERINNITTLLDEVIVLDQQRIPAVRERLQKGLNEIIDKERIDQNRLEQELIYYIEKLDITEEKVRLRTHCEYFTKTMKEASSGRKLGFITQEIGREINTIGSKANDAGIQKLVVRMKDELEKLKEQLLNVL
jgi:uncharacterized protein (TIGR00255 family)